MSPQQETTPGTDVRDGSSLLGRAADRLGVSPTIRHPRHLLAFVLASTSIGSLLIYFSGWMSLARACVWLLLPSIGLLALLAYVPGWERGALRSALIRGLWAGSFATLAYDVVRVPLAHGGVPVFKAISYFGTVLLDVPRPTLGSEIAGWSYHFSNGIGFAIMYTLLFSRAGAISAVVWGVLLELLMLATPYAEIFGYGRSTTFLALSVGAHVFYGLGLWLSLRYLARGPSSGRTSRPSGRRLAAAWLAGPAVLAAIAGDFHRLHASTIPASPPARLGPDLYVTWNVPEVDRIGAIWLMTRFVEPGARFHFVAPMSRIAFGKPFDLPEAEIRRSYRLSTFEVLLASSSKRDDPAMAPLSRMCHQAELQSWIAPSPGPETELAAHLNVRLAGCRDLDACVDRGLAWFDETYAKLSGRPRQDPVAR